MLIRGAQRDQTLCRFFSCLVWKNTFRIKQNYNLVSFISSSLLNGSFQGEILSTTGMAESLSLSPHCSVMWGPAACCVLQPVALEFLLSADNTRDMKLSAFHWCKPRNAWGRPLLVICLNLHICIGADSITSPEENILLCKGDCIMVNGINSMYCSFHRNKFK